MEYPEVLMQFSEQGWFELPQLMAFTKEKKPTVLQTLCRWAKKGWIVPIRRGLYAFPEKLAKGFLTAEQAANQIYKDSYVTGLWRMNQLGLIPEGVTEVTNATRNNPARFETPLGRFTYQHLSEYGFFGYDTVTERNARIQVATPEKALLDFFWWKPVEWNANEFARWRIQDPFKKLNLKRLKAFAKQWDQPKLIRAAQNLTEYLASA